MDKQRVAIIGASRGLGAEVAKVLVNEGHLVLGVARKTPLLEELHTLLGKSFQFLSMDLNSEEQWPTLEEQLKAFKPHRIFYMAGGGPYGAFGQRPFHSHQWAWKVTFETAARICHWALTQTLFPQVVLVGSSVCENKADPGAASYGAAKHALKGFYHSLRQEVPDWDLRLFSPGYLDTELLPKNAVARRKKLWDPHKVAGEMVSWAFDGLQKGQHKSYAEESH